jgi:ribulose-5-phosphate 4-epimerase/fuculose-1-phosphate aldolase
MSHVNLTRDICPEVFIDFCRLLYKRDLVTGVGGNVAMRYGEKILVTPSGYALRDMTVDDIVTIDNDGNVVSGKGKPSKEFAIHHGIFQLRPEVNVVCHVHGSHIIAASAMLTPGNNSLPSLTPGFVYFAYPMPMLPFLVPGTSKLADKACNEFRDNKKPALLLQNHGLITVGQTPAQALNIAEEINEAATIYVLSNGKANYISEEFFKDIKDN